MKMLLIVSGVCVGCIFAPFAWAENIDGGATGTFGDPNKPYVLDGKIDGKSNVTINGTTIWIKGEINGQSTVRLNATAGGISIGGRIDGGSQVTMNATGDIVVSDKIDGHDPLTRVTWCAPGLDVKGGVNGGVPVNKPADCKFKSP